LRPGWVKRLREASSAGVFAIFFAPLAAGFFAVVVAVFGLLFAFGFRFGR
jgi:hypothetical protein